MLSFLLSIILFSGWGYSSVPTEVKAEKLAADLESTKKTIINEEVKQRKIMSSLFDINRKMKKIVSERSSLIQERMLLEGTTTELAKKIEAMDEKLKIQKNFLRERLSAIYRFGGQGVARTLFSSTSSAQLERNLKILGLVAKRDLDLIKDYSDTVHDFEKKKARLTQRLTHLKKVESNIKLKEERLTAENTTKNKILDAIRKSKKFAMLKLNGLREKSIKLAMNDESGVLDLLFRPSFFEQKGLLPKPIDGKVVQNFGLIKDEEHKVILSHKGLTFQTKEGAPVKSVFAGVVAFAGIIEGYGNTLVIDHGDHYYSVYSYNKEILVKEGEEINQNHVIASSSEGLYFEIRHFSEPYDPSAWMKGSL
jgi:septal ring factor EnvC (AmiA/AmiB activator)